MAKNTPPTPAQPDEPTAATAADVTPGQPDDGGTADGKPLLDGHGDPVTGATVETVVVDGDLLDVPYELREDDDDDDDADDEDDERFGRSDRFERDSDARYDAAAALVAAPSGPGLGIRVGAEVLGTFALVLVIVGVVLYNPLSTVGPVGIALAAGLTLAGVTAALGHVSGGHFNPAISLASSLAGRTTWADLPLYWLAQLLGAISAAAVIFLTIPAELPGLIGADPATGEPGTIRSFMGVTANGFGEQSPLFALAGGQVTFGVRSALLIELVAAAVLAAVYLGATHRRSAAFGLHRSWALTRTTLEANRSTLHRSAPIALGLTYAALMLLTTPITGGGLNPARSSASALFAEPAALGQLWLFWVAPLLGAGIVGLVYRAVVDPSDDDLDEDLDEDDDLDEDERGGLDLLVERR